MGPPTTQGSVVFLLEIDICIGKFFARSIFGGLGDPSRTLSETILGPFLVPNRPKKSFMAIFTTTGWKQGRLSFSIFQRLRCQKPTTPPMQNPVIVQKIVRSLRCAKYAPARIRGVYSTKTYTEAVNKLAAGIIASYRLRAEALDMLSTSDP